MTILETEPQTKKRSWPNIYRRKHRAGSNSWVVDLGWVVGKRKRHSFKTKGEAKTFAEKAKTKRANEGLAAFEIPADLRSDAMKAQAVLKPFNVSLLKAAEYYRDHVVTFQNAPVVAEIIKQMLAQAEFNKRRERTVSDLRARLEMFAQDFGERKLLDISLVELKDWFGEEEWGPRTRINYLTKVSQLYNYALKHGWVENNLIERIDRPDAEDREPGIFTIAQAKKLLENSINFGLRPYIAIGLFAGLRSGELMRLKGDAIKLDEQVIVVGADVAKKRSRRIVDMCDALIDWLQPALPLPDQIVDTISFRDNMDDLRKAAGIKKWPHNGLRHSFGSYHLAFHGDQVKTAAQMGHRDANVVHQYYKALVLKAEAEKFWGLRSNF